jgi:riboflavin synthase
MFTGLVQERGRLTDDPQPSGQGGVRLEIGHSAELGSRLAIGASLAVAGVCLTVTALDGEPPLGCTVELSPETLARTNLGALRRGDPVNLEPALRMGDALGGHWVQGHVDGTTAVVDRHDLTDHRVLAFAIPADLAPYLVEKGSITVDGVSLTVSALLPDRFEVALIPHTLEVTTLSRLEPGGRVNLEVDVLAKYVHRILAARGLAPELPPGSVAGSVPDTPWNLP